MDCHTTCIECSGPLETNCLKCDETVRVLDESDN